MSQLAVLPEQLERDATTLIHRAESLVIATRDDANVAGGMLARLKELAKQIEAAFAEPIRKAHEAHKAAIAARDKYLSPVKNAERTLGGKLGAWQIEEERKHREEQERLLAEARERAKAAQLAEAEALRAMGDADLAERVVADEPEVVVPAEAMRKPAAPQGVSVRHVWDFRIVDPSALPREYLVPDEARIRKVVTALGDQANIPGVEVFRKAIMAQKR